MIKGNKVNKGDKGIVFLVTEQNGVDTLIIDAIKKNRKYGSGVKINLVRQKETLQATDGLVKLIIQCQVHGRVFAIKSKGMEQRLAEAEANKDISFGVITLTDGKVSILEPSDKKVLAIN